MGVVVYTVMLSMRREKPARATAGVAAAPVGAAGPASNVATTIPPQGASASSTATIPVMIGALPGTVPTEVPPPPPAVAVPAATLRRAGLPIRLAALLIDVVLIGLILGLVSGLLPRALHFDPEPPNMLPLLALYGAIMWKLKGTTIGGIICGLKVVRADGREMDWTTTIVRAMGCFLSLFAVGLGFIWIAIDDDKQSWHDKIAGTLVVRLPKGVPLV
jgi:uncharacterized RDD family membrane protein YckC